MPRSAVFRSQPFLKEAEQHYGNSMLYSKTTLSTLPHLCTTRSFGGLATYLSNILLFAYYLNFVYKHALTLGLTLSTLPGYIEHSENIEVISQG